jgi:hypothetical protein
VAIVCYSRAMNATQSALPDINATGPCQVQATFMCTRVGRIRLNPLAMLPDSTVKPYASVCQACYEHLADQYVAEVHS